MPDGLLLALGAGVVAAVNPCGFALLPAYLSLFVAGERTGTGPAVLRAVRASAALTIGFVAVFAIFGLAIAPVAAAVQAWLPAFTIVLGVVVALAGVWVLSGRSLPSIVIGGRKNGESAPITRFWPMVGFGASYAIASLGCTIAPFLAVVVSAFRAGTILDGLLLFVAYALAMGLVVTAAALSIALARTSGIARIRSAGAWLPRLGGLLLIVAGGYVAWYGVWELRVLHGGAGNDPLIDAAGVMQQWLAETFAAIGPLGFLLIIAVLAGGAFLIVRMRANKTPTA